MTVVRFEQWQREAASSPDAFEAVPIRRPYWLARHPLSGEYVTSMVYVELTKL